MRKQNHYQLLFHVNIDLECEPKFVLVILMNKFNLVDIFALNLQPIEASGLCFLYIPS